MSEIRDEVSIITWYIRRLLFPMMDGCLLSVFLQGHSVIVKSLLHSVTAISHILWRPSSAGSDDRTFGVLLAKCIRRSVLLGSHLRVEIQGQQEQGHTKLTRF